MTPALRCPRFPIGPLLAAVSLGFALLQAGCTTAPRRGRTEPRATTAAPVTLPARIVSNFFLIESRQADGRTRRFLIDTGSSITYVSSEFAATTGLRERGGPRTVAVTSANGATTTLPAVTMRQLRLGSITLERVPAAIFDFSELSAHLGVPLDGLIAFPEFRDHLLTLDYVNARLVLEPYPATAPAIRKTSPRESALAFSNEERVPFIPVQLGNESFVVLIDTGSDGGLSLNPTGLHPRFLAGPRPGTLVSSVAGDRQQLVGRLAQDLLIGGHTVANPIVDLTEHVSALGGELLRHFILTFDQRRNVVTLVRDSEGPVQMAPRRSTGLAFARSPIYWRVMAVVPDTPTAALNLSAGDLVVRINGEPVEAWSFERYAALLETSAKITYTFLDGTREHDVEVPVFELVP